MVIEKGDRDMKKLLVVVMLLSLTACGKTNIVKHEYIKNYTLGETKTAFTGEPLIKIRDVYFVIRKEDQENCYYVMPSDDFIISGKYVNKLRNREVNIKGFSKRLYAMNDYLKASDNKYPFMDYIVSMTNNKTETDKVKYPVIDFVTDDGNVFGFMVDSNNKLILKSVFEQNHDQSSMYKMTEASVTPENTKMIVTKNIAPCYNQKYKTAFVSQILGRNNYELLYGGINDITINLTYREFTRDDLARSSFFQNIVYGTSAKEIRFKNFKIEVIDSTNEKITYRVIEDKLEDTVFTEDGSSFESLEQAEQTYIGSRQQKKL